MTTWASKNVWKIESDDLISRTVVTYPEQTETFPQYVRVKSEDRKLILKTRKRRGASGKVLRFATDLNVTVADSIDSSGTMRYRIYWLTHSPNGVLGVLTLLFLVIGTIFTGLSTIHGWSNPSGFKVGEQARFGFGLEVAAVVLSGVRELFTERVTR